MKVQAEIYKGIEYIRISKLPEDQKQVIRDSLNPELIIKILKDDELLVDCVQFQHYVLWFDEQFEKTRGVAATTENEAAKKLKLA